MKCLKCNLEFPDADILTEEVPLPNGGKHIKGSCPGCGSYIKFLPQYFGSPKFYVGKYKGMTVEAVAKVDMAYLRWALKVGMGGDKVGNEIAKLL